MNPARWYVKKNGDARIYALTENQADAQLLAERLERSTGEKFYAMKKPAQETR
jgi:hypothetical protein